jgi:hypothetical protein
MAARSPPPPAGPDVHEHIAFLERQVAELEVIAGDAMGGEKPQLGAAVSARAKAADLQKKIVQLRTWAARQEPRQRRRKGGRKKDAALALVAAGRSSTEVARELGVDRRTVNTWRSDPEFDEALRELQDAQMDAVHTLLVSRALEVARCLSDVATAPDTSDMARVAAARAFMELLGRHKNDPVKPPTRVADIETEEDLLAALREIPVEVLEESLATRRPRAREL